ncbi:hypothetical protein ACTWJ8_39945 (plasmid) [Streptomyces sp. SDT5-1]|uniref:hypothetical protein n=1 Tax=Streptomyces sp. SDT5-1 TaxID=3406418 RepID=UPI003FD6A22E
MNIDTVTDAMLQRVAHANRTEDTDVVQALLEAGHTAWCEGLAEMKMRVTDECEGADDTALRARCRDNDLELEADLTRTQVISELGFAEWESSPAALAYSELVDRASRLGVTLVDEVFE